MLRTPFPAARYRFEAVVESTLHLPEYAGSTLRGAFGNALRRTACMTREKECKPCPLYRSCPFPAIFQPPPPADHDLQKFSEIPAPFVVEPPEWGEREYTPGETLRFHFVLCGKALPQLPLAAYAWQRALGHGIGRGDGTARLQRIWLETPLGDQSVFDAEQGQIQPHDHAIPPPDPALAQANTLTLRHITPLRLQHQGVPIRPEALTARDFLVALVRRTALVSEFHVGSKLPLDFADLSEQAAGIQARKQLQWRDWTRYSSRQKQEMVLGGCVGTWTLEGNLAPFMPYLYLGQWLHAGKNASFGLGRYEITA